MCILVVLLMLLANVAYGQSFPVNGVIDDFNRTNEDPVTGDWSNLVFGNGSGFGCQVDTNELSKATGNPGDGCWYNASTYEAAQEVYMTMPNATNHTDTSPMRLLFCLHNSVGTSATLGYSVTIKKESAATDTITLEYINGADSYTDIGADFNQEVDDGDRVGVTTDGAGNFDIYFDDAGGGWSLLGSRSDSTYSCGSSYLGVHLKSSTFDLDNFGGGNVNQAAASGMFSIIQFR